MSQAQLVPISPQIIGRPCAKCGTAMVLAYIRPKAIGVDQHTFECIKCGYDEKTLVNSASVGAAHAIGRGPAKRTP